MLFRSFINLRLGRPGLLPKPVERLPYDDAVLARFADMDALSCSAVGDPAQVTAKLAEIARRTGADELILTAQIHDHAARKRSFALVAEAVGMAASLAA